MSLPPPRLFRPSTDQSLLPRIAQIHADCITHDHQLATFLPPLDPDRLIAFWRRQTARIDRGEAEMVLQFAPSSSSSSAADDDGERQGEGELAGYVCLHMPESETIPFRGVVEKLMVCTRQRQKGIARRLMGKLEEVAREKKRGLLMLDTTVGLPAELVYVKLGYTEYGVVPKYGISPKDGTLVDGRMFYKDLRDHDE